MNYGTLIDNQLHPAPRWAVTDTVLLPADWTLARQRNKKDPADKERN